MARMYAKIKGSTLNEGLVKSGERFKKNKNISVDVDIERISNIVYGRVMQKINNDEPTSPKPNEAGETPDKTKDKKRRGLHLSTLTMMTQAITSSAWSLRESTRSTDEAQHALNSYTAVKGVGTLVIGAYSPLLASVLRMIDSLVGQGIKNQIQLQYDNSRLEYNLTRMDVGRYSTYTYDTEQQKWIARDVEKIKHNVLNQT